ncbi:asparagine synthase (glutamine-hydrolyzing) [Mangrovimonas futianensis]|uniref:asparagine synthase (glutamine-hydrolyzing) n=1 Tax=Mangrovimonas futianensis TaxID=2895523 RepID=UPI001E2C45AF|nr:asparagine synthase (glutamine-hydrolyzing) [Mangrovimonas futianensis]MCF1421965.1 asparagine synthase (glutamine-hydrolyzing) [Mangrovimonas futianensis]
MCGINGIISYHSSSIEDIENRLLKMNNQIIHRGPDDCGHFVQRNTTNQVGMAMRRLSIIDLNTGHQPIYNQDKSLVIVFNGEIYNYQNLRFELENAGATFQTQSDTEVILKLYEFQGPKAFSKLDGMFAFSIYDKKEEKVIIARDLFGEKPLYYYHGQNEFIWASELKSIVSYLNFKPAISNQGLSLFLKLTYIPAPYTIYNDIYKLNANSYIEFNIQSNAFKTHLINELKNYTNTEIQFLNAKSKVRDLVMESIESRSISDVPLGTFLSGGVDSSIVSWGLSKIKNERINTYSIGFEKEAFDETDKAKTVAKLIKSNHHEFILKESDIEESIHEIILNFDEPFADPSSLPTYMVSKLTREHVKVALTGDGGDEVFGGYNKYYMGKLNTHYTRWVPKSLHNATKDLTNKLLSSKDDSQGIKFKLKKLINSVEYGNSYYWNIISQGFLQPEHILQEDFVYENPFDHYQEITKHLKLNSLNDFRELDRHVSLEGDMLVKVDRTSMFASLECRAPFLNKKLWKYTNSLPSSFLLNGWNKKHILKETFKSEFPEGFLEKSKQGFVVPVGDWLRSSLKKEVAHYVSNEFLNKQDVFQKDQIQDLLNNHLTGNIDSSRQAWTFYVFQKWYEKNYL